MDALARPAALEKLIQNLHLRKQMSSGTYHLFLTSAISLTPDARKRMCGEESWGAFRKYMQGLSVSDRIHLLSYHLDEKEYLDGYKALAYLIRAGYFSTILTTNLDSTLEETLIEAGIRPGDMRIFLVGRDQPSYIAASLANSTRQLSIIKLHGSLREGVLSERFPALFTFPREIEESLARYFAQDMIIVGDVEREGDCLRSFPILGGNAVYYAVPSQSLSEDDSIVRLLEARNLPPEAFVIAGPYGDFNTFFQTLQLAFPASPLPSIRITFEPPAPGKPRPFTVQSASPAGLALPEPSSVADVFLVTATERETRAVLAQVRHQPQLSFLRDRAYYDLGLIGNARVFLAQSEKHAGGLGGARQTVSEGIQVLNPPVVVMVGIACGLRPEEQHIGDILISEKIVAYEQQRIGTDQKSDAPAIRMLGYRVPASASVLNRFRSGYVLVDFTSWPSTPQVFFGLILSGDKLLDNQAARADLLAQEPKAIGLEMEGTGLYEAAATLKADWLLVKAISDWGDGKKAESEEHYQKIAAENAARFTLQIIEQGGFAREKT